MGKGVFEILKISSEGLNLQRARLSSIAKNIANANTTRTPGGGPYKREIVVSRAVEKSEFQEQLESIVFPFKSYGLNQASKKEQGESASYVSPEVYTDDSERLVYDPSHPEADENGYVHYPNINVVTEMVEMISAQRAFEANVSVIEAAKNIARDSLDI
ncbi:flagellar basal body rod protein FlgC [Bacteroidetes/Chlorobi group bacterium Naka2016]|jgi:flagellar basal-body rod protein FlgC|nr:MAG: flagellar basal body rod protein FlgC [Bacteroidetes/Chlorobi group bacterium Naka2016]